MTAIAGLWLADKTLDEVLDAARSAGESAQQDNIESYFETGNEKIDYFRALIQAAYAEGGWDGLVDLLRRIQEAKQLMSISPLNISQIPTDLVPVVIPIWWCNQCIQFLGTITSQESAAQQTGDPVQLWAEWMTLQRYGELAYYHDTGGSPAKGVWRWLFA